MKQESPHFGGTGGKSPLSAVPQTHHLFQIVEEEAREVNDVFCQMNLVMCLFKNLF